MTKILALAIVKGKVADYAVTVGSLNGLKPNELAIVLREIAEELHA